MARQSLSKSASRSRKKRPWYPCIGIILVIVALTILVIITATSLQTTSSRQEPREEAPSMISKGEQYLGFTTLNCTLYALFCVKVFTIVSPQTAHSFSLEFPVLRLNDDSTEFVEFEAYPQCVYILTQAAASSSSAVMTNVFIMTAMEEICPPMTNLISMQTGDDSTTEKLLFLKPIDDPRRSSLLSLLKLDVDSDNLLNMTEWSGLSLLYNVESNRYLFAIQNEGQVGFLCRRGSAQFEFVQPSPTCSCCLVTVDAESPISLVYNRSNALTFSTPYRFPTTAPAVLTTNQPTQQPTTKNKLPTDYNYTGAEYFGSKPNIIFILLDDLGYNDVAFSPFSTPRDKILEATSFISNLAKQEGLILTRHYAHWHCSPSRRSFLTGRLSIHTGEYLSIIGDDDMDLRMEWISERLKEADYKNYFFGKLHTGMKSVFHHPMTRGFDKFIGFLGGKADYYDFHYWDGFQGNEAQFAEYSTEFYTRRAMETLNEHRVNCPNNPFFIYLSYQSPHTPIKPPNINDASYSDFTNKKTNPYEFMLYAANKEIEHLVTYLKVTGLWSNTLFVFSSDNGATSKALSVEIPFNAQNAGVGNNYPFRGEKSTSFEGAFRVANFVSGGLVPVAVRGKQSNVISHIVDWYSTFAFLAGRDLNQNMEEIVSKIEQSGIDMTKVVPKNPYVTNQESGERQNLWDYFNIYPPVDGINLVPYLFDPKRYDEVEASLQQGYHVKERQKLMLSTEVMLFGKYKFVLGQPCALESADEEDDRLLRRLQSSTQCKASKKTGWLGADAKTYTQDDASLGCLEINNPYDLSQSFNPCVFDLENDPREQHPATDAQLIEELWIEFNASLIYQYNRFLTGKEQGLTPTELMNCVSKGKALDLFGTNSGPQCDLDSCIISAKGTTCPQYRTV